MYIYIYIYKSFKETFILKSVIFRICVCVYICIYLWLGLTLISSITRDLKFLVPATFNAYTEMPHPFISNYRFEEIVTLPGKLASFPNVKNTV